MMDLADTGLVLLEEAPLFSLTIVPPPSAGEEGHVIFGFSHSLGDGMSAVILANDFFASVARDTASTAAPAPLKLEASMLEALCGTAAAPKVLALPADEATMETIVAPFFKAMITDTPTLPVDPALPRKAELQHLKIHSQFPALKTNHIILEGSPAKFVATRTACKEHAVTLNAAYTAAFVVAYSRQAESMEKVPGKTHCNLSYCYDTRGARSDAAIPASTVGTYFNFAPQQPIASGVPLDTKFWELASAVLTACKSDVTSPMQSFVYKMVDKLCDKDMLMDLLHGQDGGVRAGTMLSNKGSFAGATNIAFAGAAGSDSGITLTANYTLLGMQSPVGEACHWFSTVAGRPTYCASHKMEPRYANRFYENAVKVYEAIATVGDSESIGDVASRLLGPQYSAAEFYASAPAAARSSATASARIRSLQRVGGRGTGARCAPQRAAIRSSSERAITCSR